MAFIGEFIATFIIVWLIAKLCTMRKEKNLTPEEKRSFEIKRLIIVAIISIAFILFSGAMTTLA